jgi:hypothetical protein
LANGVLVYGDRVAAGTVTVSTEVPTLLGTNLQHPHLSTPWRSTANSASITVDFGTSYTIGGLFLGPTNMTAAGTVRVRISANSDLSTPTHDSGASPILAGVDPTFGHLIYVLSTPAAGRYLKLDLADSSLTYIQAGRLFAGTKFQPTRNFSYDYTESYIDTTGMSRSESGQVWIETGTQYREMRVQYRAATHADAQGDYKTIARLGRQHDILFVLDPASSNLGRDSIFGLIAQNLSLQRAHNDIYALDLIISESK